MNIDTGYVSPQFHVVFDDLFTSVPNAKQGEAWWKFPRSLMPILGKS
jgi:hypothetical protein